MQGFWQNLADHNAHPRARSNTEIVHTKKNHFDSERIRKDQHSARLDRVQQRQQRSRSRKKAAFEKNRITTQLREAAKKFHLNPCNHEDSEIVRLGELEKMPIAKLEALLIMRTVFQFYHYFTTTVSVKQMLNYVYVGTEGEVVIYSGLLEGKSDEKSSKILPSPSKDKKTCLKQQQFSQQFLALLSQRVGHQLQDFILYVNHYRQKCTNHLTSQIALSLIETYCCCLRQKIPQRLSAQSLTTLKLLQFKKRQIFIRKKEQTSKSSFPTHNFYLPKKKPAQHSRGTSLFQMRGRQNQQKSLKRKNSQRDRTTRQAGIIFTIDQISEQDLPINYEFQINIRSKKQLNQNGMGWLSSNQESRHQKQKNINDSMQTQITKDNEVSRKTSVNTEQNVQTTSKSQISFQISPFKHIPPISDTGSKISPHKNGFNASMTVRKKDNSMRSQNPPLTNLKRKQEKNNEEADWLESRKLVWTPFGCKKAERR